jgi:hypothetical protein
VLLIYFKPSPFEAWIEQYCCPVDGGDIGLIVVLDKLLPAAIDIDAEVKFELSVFDRRQRRLHGVSSTTRSASRDGWSCSYLLGRRPLCATAFVPC